MMVRLTSETAAARHWRKRWRAGCRSGNRRLPCMCTVVPPMRSTSPRPMTPDMGVGRRQLTESFTRASRIAERSGGAIVEKIRTRLDAGGQGPERKRQAHRRAAEQRRSALAAPCREIVCQLRTCLAHGDAQGQAATRAAARVAGPIRIRAQFVSPPAAFPERRRDDRRWSRHQGLLTRARGDEKEPSTSPCGRAGTRRAQLHAGPLLGRLLGSADILVSQPHRNVLRRGA